jgi:hypothetical protein
MHMTCQQLLRGSRLICSLEPLAARLLLAVPLRDALLLILVLSNQARRLVHHSGRGRCVAPLC